MLWEIVMLTEYTRTSVKILHAEILDIMRKYDSFPPTPGITLGRKLIRTTYPSFTRAFCGSVGREGRVPLASPYKRADGKLMPPIFSTKEGRLWYTEELMDLLKDLNKGGGLLYVYINDEDKKRLVHKLKYITNLVFDLCIKIDKI